MANAQHIIFVDDDDDFRQLCVRLLQRGLPMVQITQFRNPRTVLDSLSTHAPQLLITNYQMPEMTGLELIQTIRTQGHALPILLISGSEMVEQEVQQSGASRFLSKYQAMTELVQVVQELLGIQ